MQSDYGSTNSDLAVDGPYSVSLGFSLLGVAGGMEVKAVHFAQHTLKPRQVTALANKRLKSKVNVTKLVEDFQARFKRSPWCPDLSVDVDAWRGDLWASALHAQGVQNPAALGRKLHETFRRVRLANFSFLPEVN